MTNAICVVAHHDDHLLWMGATIQRTQRIKGWDWTVIAMCITPQTHDYFAKSCADLRTKWTTMSFENYQGEQPFARNNRAKMEARLYAEIAGTKYDFAFTHSRHYRGEYGGHANHTEVEQVVTSLVRQGKLGAGTNHLAYFSYQVIEGHTAPTASFAESWRTHYLPLTYEEQEWKLKWARSTPDSLAGIGCPCPNPEAFEGDNLALGRPILAQT